MYHYLMDQLKRPPLYTKTKAEFWNDEYISKQMLKAHLDPNFDAASRNHKFIEKSVNWIKRIVPPSQYPLQLDLGCGPGLYTERFAKAGYTVTGIDFSQRSIHHAIESAMNQDLDITYLYQDYTNMTLYLSFNLATMIFCDYGALSMDERNSILYQVRSVLQPNGKFLFDVFTMNAYRKLKEVRTWNVVPKDGFWRPNEHMVLEGTYLYEGHIALRQYVIVTNNDYTPYYLWDTYFTREDLVEEVEKAGFRVCEIYSDVAGTPYDESSDTMVILLEKR